MQKKLGTRTSFGSVYMNYTVVYLALMHECSYYDAIFYILQLTVWHGSTMQQTCVCIPEGALEHNTADPECNICLQAATSSRIIILPRFSCFWERGEAKIVIDTEIQLIRQPYLEFKLSCRW